MSILLNMTPSSSETFSTGLLSSLALLDRFIAGRFANRFELLSSATVPGVYVRPSVSNGAGLRLRGASVGEVGFRLDEPPVSEAVSALRFIVWPAAL